MDTFFFIILGTRPVVRHGEAVIKRHCPSCGDWRNFRAVNWQNYFTLFFIPIFPLGSRKEGYACVTCGMPMGREIAAAGSGQESAGQTPGLPAAESMVVQCPRCDGRMRVPLRERGYVATCPHCSLDFKVMGEREPIPEADIRE